MSTKQTDVPKDTARKLMAAKKMPKQGGQETLPACSARQFELMGIMVEDMDRGFRGFGEGNRWTRPSLGDGMESFVRRTYQKEVTGEQSR